ncbi:sensor histidine kinase, partial [Glutamicibacter arilaitensis]
MKSFRAQWRRTSLRTKLVTVMLGLMIVAIFATAVGSAHTLRIAMTNQIDKQLNVSKSTMAYGLNKAYLYSLNEDSGSHDALDVDATLLGLSSAYADIRDQDGEIVYVMPRSRVGPSNGTDLPLLNM